jgi:predicted dehydrogenase
MTIEDAEDLVRIAAERGLAITAAPCSILGEAALAAGQAIQNGRLGRVRLAYAEMEDSMVFRERFHDWRSPSGAPWPADDEFAVGCTLEHAGYYLTWLCAFFGPAQEITAFSARLFDQKGIPAPKGGWAGDFSVACLRFADGVVARLTCGLAAPKDRSLHVVGTEGTLTVTDGWNYRSGVWLRDPEGRPMSRIPKLPQAFGRIERYLPGRHWLGERLPLGPNRAVTPGYPSRMDFSRGPAATAEALRAGKPVPMPADFALHITELALVAQDAARFPSPYKPRTAFAPLPIN